MNQQFQYFGDVVVCGFVVEFEEKELELKISIVTPNYNGARFLEKTAQSIVAQRTSGFELEWIVMDGGSTDSSLEILERYRDEIDMLVSEPDKGPADAINKGLALATGDLLGWLNADDVYEPGALKRVIEVMEAHPKAALCFGHCPVVDADGVEVRQGITHFKEFFYPISCRFIFQILNYVSQPAMFFRRTAYEAAGPLDLGLKAAWDYDLILRLWRQGQAIRMQKPALSNFRWTPESISGTHFELQFKEELELAVRDAGRWSLQAGLHHLVRWGIVTIYKSMQRKH